MRTLRSISIGLVLALSVCGAALADANPILVLGGTDISPVSTYTSLGVIASLSGNLNASGPIARIWGDRLTYDFNNNGMRIGAVSWGHSLSLGYEFKDRSGFESVYGGVDSRTTNLSPLVASTTEGSHTGARFELDAFRDLSSEIHANIIGSYATSDDEYWTRAELLTGAAGKAQFGPAIVVQGNPDYHGFRSGLALENLRFTAHLGAALTMGYQNMNGGSGIYTGLSLSLLP